MSTPIILKGGTKALRPAITQLMAMHQLFDGKDMGAIYGIPVQAFQEAIRFLPQVTLFFSQKEEDIDKELGVVLGRISFRILNESASTMTPAKALALANKIKLGFGGDTPFFYNKGKRHYSYIRPDKGIETQVYVSSESEAKKLIGEVLDVQAINKDWDYLKDCTKTADLSTPTNGYMGKEMIYGELINEPRRLPVAVVHFIYAEMHIHGYPKGIILVDQVGKKSDALIKGYS